MNRYKRRGWFGDSQGHSLAAKGIATRYAAKKTVLRDQIFFASKHEELLPTSHIQEMIQDGWNFQRMQQMHPDVDREDMRQRGIKAWESQHGSNTLSTIDRQGVDASVRVATLDPRFKRSIQNVLDDGQGRSFIPEVKANALSERLRDLEG